METNRSVGIQQPGSRDHTLVTAKTDIYVPPIGMHYRQNLWEVELLNKMRHRTTFYDQ